MTISIITDIGVNLKPILNVSSSLNLNHVKSNAVTVGYNPLEASRPTTRKYSMAV